MLVGMAVFIYIGIGNYNMNNYDSAEPVSNLVYIAPIY